MEFSISDELILERAGIYKLVFNTGHFYIGSSICLKKRIMAHCSDSKMGFKYNKSLRKVAGKVSSGSFSLIQYVDMSLSGISILGIEYGYIKIHIDNPLLLNDPMYGTGTATITGIIRPEQKQMIKDIAKIKSITPGRIVGKLIEIGLQNIPEDWNYSSD